MSNVPDLPELPKHADAETEPPDWQALLQQLQAIVDDRGLLTQMEKEERNLFFRLVNAIAQPDRTARRRLSREFRRQRREEVKAQKSEDEKLLEQTGIRVLSRARFKTPSAPAPFEIAPPVTENQQEEHFAKERLSHPRTCYICKRDYDRVHFFYDSMCPDCAELNYQKRQQTYDLSGRYALLTGGRVKIGYQAALKLLRAGAHVIVTTRFPRDAARRYAAEEDSAVWNDRLQIHGLDLRHVPSVEAFADHLVETLPRLDFILNNACQTVRRPPGFYQHLMDAERRLASQLQPNEQLMLQSYETLRSKGSHESLPPIGGGVLPEEVGGSTLGPDHVGFGQAAELSQLELIEGDEQQAAFPVGKLDGDEQQIDLRDINSWRLRLAEVSTVELLEVHVVNAVAPFVLNARLKPLMERVATRDNHIVNVSAMEGVFYRAYKTDKHPHTNMAKAALNMMTRTSAQDYIHAGIHMNSVDTGWITDEDPAQIAEFKQKELGFHPPLDLIDAAARICDPIFAGFLSGEHQWGKFLKDYQVANW